MLFMEDKEEKQDKQVEYLDRNRGLEAKFTILCRVAFGINFKVTKWDQANDQDIVEVAEASIYPSTRSNPIIVDDALGQVINGKAKVYGIPSQVGPPKIAHR